MSRLRGDGDRHHRCLRRRPLQGRQEGRRRGGGRGRKAREPKLDILDDPVRMYLKQMGQVPLLTREQEVEISKRIEDAELDVQKHINRFGFIARAHLDLAQKLHGRPRTLRPRDPRQENREPRALHEGAAAACASSSKNAARKSLDAYTQLRRSTAARTTRPKSLPGFQEGARRPAEALPEVLLQAEGHRGIRAPGGRESTACINSLHGRDRQTDAEAARPASRPRGSITPRSSANMQIRIWLSAGGIHRANTTS